MSDELNCVKEEVTSQNNTCEYQCSDGVCISEGELCNGEHDCQEREEEGGCYKDDPNLDNSTITNLCDIENGGCDHFCAQDGLIQTCSCQEGYQLVSAFTCRGNNLIYVALL